MPGGENYPGSENKNTSIVELHDFVVIVVLADDHDGEEEDDEGDDDDGDNG